MGKAKRILQLIRNKERNAHLLVNPVLWELFRMTCREEGVSANHKISELVLEYLEEKGVLEKFLNGEINIEEGKN